MSLPKINMGDVKIGECPFRLMHSVRCAECYNSDPMDSDQFLCTCNMGKKGVC